MVVLRDYQREAVQCGVEAARRGAKRVLLCSPVGSGKTVIMSELIRMARRPIVVSPSLNLLGQLHRNLEHWLGERVGIEQGLNRVNEIAGLKERAAVCSYASMMSNDRYARKSFDGTTLVIVDECHLNVTPAFRRMMAHFESMGAVAIGLSATPYKGRGKPLPYWDRPAFSYSLLQAIRDGYLVRPKGILCQSTTIDLSLVREVAHAWNDLELNAVLEAERAVQEISSLVLQTHERKPSAVYCNSVRQARLLADVFDRYGVKASIVYSEQPKEERQANMDAFTSGATKIICNVGILAYGWDFPQLVNIYNAAPTQSLSVYEQRIGRGTRVLPGVIKDDMTPEERRAAIAASAKPHFNIYDLTDTSRSIQLVNALDVLDAACRECGERRQSGVKALEEAPPQEGADLIDLIDLQDKAEELKRKRRDIIVGVAFEHEERDLFAAPGTAQKKERGWRMLYGPHAGKLIRDLPSGYLSHVLKRKPYGKTIALHAAIRQEMSRRTA